MADLAVWGEREALIHRAAREIAETGQVCADTYMELRRLEVEPAEVATRLGRYIEQDEETA